MAVKRLLLPESDLRGMINMRKHFYNVEGFIWAKLLIELASFN